MTGSGKFGYPHRNKTYRSVTGILVMYLCLFMTACSLGPKKIYDWPAQEGVVINKETGEPIAGAWVTGRWKGYNYDRTVCFHADATQTDEQGRFVFPAWRNREGNFENSANQRLETDVYAQGYRDVGGHTFRLEMIPFVGSREERLDDLSRSVTGSSCVFAGASGRNLYPYYETIYLEAKSLASLPEDAKKLQWYRWVAASAAISSDTRKPHDEYQREREEFLKDNLK